MLQVRTIWTAVNGAPYYTNMYFMGDTDPEAETAVDLTAAFFQALAARIGASTDGVVQPEVNVVDPVNGQITSTHTTTPGSIATTGTGSFLPYATQGLARLRTNTFVNGRRLRGRIFIPSPTQTGDNNGVPLAAYISDVNAALATLIAPGALAVWSRTHGVVQPVVQADCWNQWAVLRSRRP